VINMSNPFLQQALNPKRMSSIVAFSIIVSSLLTLAITSFQVNMTQVSTSAQSSPNSHNVKSIEKKVKSIEEKVKSMERKVLQQLEAKVPSGPKVLPQCDELMSRPNSIFADGGFITRHTTPHTWTPRADGSMELDLAAICTLKRYTRDEARHCLADKHVTFVGDSLSRYQFNSLAYFIEKGIHPPRFPRANPCTHIDENGNPACSPADEPNICMEGDWKYTEGDSWTNFFMAMGGGEANSTGIFGGRLQCPCARSDGVHVEDALYVSEPDANGSRTTISYLVEIGWGDNFRNLSGFDFTDCAYNGTCHHSLEDVAKVIERAKVGDFDYNQPFPDAIDPVNGVLRKTFPPVHYAFYNRYVKKVYCVFFSYCRDDNY
jgi:hypothetical protein